MKWILGLLGFVALAVAIVVGWLLSLPVLLCVAGSAIYDEIRARPRRNALGAARDKWIKRESVPGSPDSQNVPHRPGSGRIH